MMPDARDMRAPNYEQAADQANGALGQWHGRAAGGSGNRAPQPKRRHAEQRRAEQRRAEQVEGAGLEAAAAPAQSMRHPRWRALWRGRAGLTLYLVGVAALCILAVATRAMSVLPPDLPFTRELQESRAPALYAVMVAVSWLGSPLPVTVITVAILGALWALRMRVEAVWLAVSLLADALGALLKLVVERQRPSSALVHVVQSLHTYSFPSGHVLHYSVFYGFLLYLLATNFRRSWWRDALLGLLAALIVLVGPSRVYLGAHWLSDVLASYLLAALCLVPLMKGYLWTKEHYELVGFPPRLKRV